MLKKKDLLIIAVVLLAAVALFAGSINRIHITPEYVEMESSTCENQDCIGEGEVNVNTYKDRILSTYIICLPNQVTIEMVPADE